MAKFYHGTSFPAYEGIKEEGFCSKNTIWTVSDERFTYLRKEDEYGEGFEFAHDAAIVAAAMINQFENGVVIFEFEVPEEIETEYFSEDSSCENMDYCYEVYSEDLNMLIQTKQIQVTVHLLTGAYNPNLRIFCLPYNNPYLMSIGDADLLDAVEQVQKAEIFLDCIYEYEDDVVLRDDLPNWKWINNSASMNAA